jgi:hypothetical protein
VYRKTFLVAATITRLRGLSNTDLLHEHDRFLAAKQRAARVAAEDDTRDERRQEADYLARRIGQETRKGVALGTLDAANGNGYTRWS